MHSSFQCDCCWFLNLHKRIPLEDSPSDQVLLAYIRRVNLDVMWSKEGGTVRNAVSNLLKAKAMSEELGLPPQPLQVGPWPVGDFQGFQTALEMLKASKRPGRNDKSYTQFDTIRKIRAAYQTA